jgi:serine/threonine protein kinase
MVQTGRQVKSYRIVNELGRGGMAVVYVAEDVVLRRRVALKALESFEGGLAQRFLREARTAAALSHPSIVPVFEYFEDSGTLYIAMELLARGSLRAYIGELTLPQIGAVLEEVLAGLSEGERQGVVHRDLKPENILVSGDGRVKIADYGIAKATSHMPGSGHLTVPGMTVGTPAYMAPEQALGVVLGPQTDLYALGCVSFELVTGQLPFRDVGSPIALAMRHVNEAPPSVLSVAPGVPEELAHWIDQLLVKDPAERPASAEAAADQLEHYLIDQFGPRWRQVGRLGPPPVAADERSITANSTVGNSAIVPMPGPFTPPPPDRANADDHQASSNVCPEPTDPSASSDAEQTARGGTGQPFADGYETYHSRPVEHAHRAQEPRDSCRPDDVDPGAGRYERLRTLDEAPSSQAHTAPELDGRAIRATSAADARSAPDSPNTVDSRGSSLALPETVPPRGPTQPPPRDDSATGPWRRPTVAAALLLVSLATVLLLSPGNDDRRAPEPQPTATPASAPPSPTTLSVDPLSVALPAGWHISSDDVDIDGLAFDPRAVAAPMRDRQEAMFLGMAPAAGTTRALLPAAFVRRLRREGRPLPTPLRVALGSQRLAAYRYDGVALGDGRRLTMFAIPTSAGVATLACSAPAQSPDATSETCVDAAASLRLDGSSRITVFEAEPDGALARTLNTHVGNLDAIVRRRVKRMRSLPAAGQAGQAREIADAFRRSAIKLRRLAVHPADYPDLQELVERLRSQSQDYRALTAAAGALDVGSYRRARRSVAVRRRAVNRILEAIEKAAYAGTLSARLRPARIPDLRLPEREDPTPLPPVPAPDPDPPQPTPPDPSPPQPGPPDPSPPTPIPPDPDPPTPIPPDDGHRV